MGLAVVDSGASVSIIDECFVSNLSATVDTTSVPWVEAVNGDLLAQVGRVNLDIQLGG